ncbi:ABC transporter permease [Leptospira jelokensis]|uniref:ABC transporter permease n=1 Tax=Leptospira jelokensis TaxID=2484931 RepID=A0A4Z1A0B8_9LEPT|nr:ABC transporter permease [Leptospira jelokensis]TGL67550.1 ABC transporter permease [Leptospira jelokensis]
MHSKWNLGSIGLKTATLLGFLFIHIPILIIIMYAFSTDEKTFQFPLPGFTTKWFGVAWDRNDIWEAIILSSQVALVSTFIAIFLGTLACLAVYRSQFFGKEVISFLVILPIALPGIVTGISLRSAMSLFGIPFSTWTIVIAHATFCIVTVYNNVLARLRRSSHSMVEASMDLGANPWQTFRFVILPNIATALLAGGMLSFALSFDEVIVTTFTAGQQSTVPIWMLTEFIRPRQRPVTNVVAVFVILVTTIPILVAYYLTKEDDGRKK